MCGCQWRLDAVEQLEGAKAMFSIRVSEESHESIVERAQGIQILRVREKSQKVRVGPICESMANLGFLEVALDILRLFYVFLVKNFGGCSKMDKAIEELLVLR